MDGLILRLLEFPPAEPLSDFQYDQAIREVSQLIATEPINKLVSVLSSGESVLDVLDPSKQSLAYVHVLSAHIHIAHSTSKAPATTLAPAVLPSGKLWSHIVAIVEQFDPIQVRYAGDAFRRILEIVGKGAIQTQNPFPAVILLQHAIIRLDPTSSTLTSTHHLFLRLCLHGRAFQHALPVLDRTIYHIASKADNGSAASPTQYLCAESDTSLAYLNPDTGLTQTKFSARRYLEYHLYGAMVYMGLRQWERAVSFLEIVLLAPTTAAMSSVMVEAYKKYVLVCLLIDGKAPSPAKWPNRNVLRDMRALAIPYDCLVDAFTAGSLIRLKRVVEEGQSFWLSDCNFGLVVQVYESFRKFSVLRLAEVYVALPLTGVAQRTSPDPANLEETASYTTMLITSGELKATLTPSSDPALPATLRFLSATSIPWSEDRLRRKLDDQQTELQGILRHLQNSESRLETRKEYIETLRALKVQKEQAAKAGSGGFGGGRSLDDFDEDVMGVI